MAPRRRLLPQPSAAVACVAFLCACPAEDETNSGTETGASSDTEFPDSTATDPAETETGEYQPPNCEAETTRDSCLNESDVFVLCGWIEPPRVFADGFVCEEFEELEGSCVFAMTDVDCGSSGPACPGAEETPYYREVDGATELLIARWDICSDALPIDGFTQCEQDGEMLSPPICNCACDA